MIETVDSYRALCEVEGCGWKSNPSVSEGDAQDSLDYHDWEVHQLAEREAAAAAEAATAEGGAE